MKRELESVDIPDEHEARARAWAVIEAGFAGRQPVEHRARRLWPAVAVAAVFAVVAAALSPPGRAVVDEIREAVGVKSAQSALFSLPAPGRLLVSSDAGVWVVQQDGSKRLLGDYREASWSPYGRFVVAARENELAALEPDGDVRWSLARPGVSSPRWAGTETDTRIAYVDRTGIRIVAGDGTQDRLLVPKARGPLAWRPGRGFVLAYAAARSIRVVDSSTGRILWEAARPPGRARLEWSATGALMLVLAPHHIRLYFSYGAVAEQSDPKQDEPHMSAARPRSDRFALALERPTQSFAYIMSGRKLFNGPGVFSDLTWSPDGRWVLVGWPTADQWVFVDADSRRIRAVANVSEQFRSQSFPEIQGWVP